jgi:NADH-quinone oxidoreductase subunit A
MLGLLYVWKKGDLEWIRAVKGDPRGAQNVSSRARARAAVADPEPAPRPALAARESAVEGGAE